MVITNDGELARALEMPNFSVERSYRVRVFGRMFDESKLTQMRRGVTMNGRKYGPYVMEVEKRQNTNTWLHMKMWEGKNNEIRRLMRKFSLRVNRLQRTRYGPYTLGQVPDTNNLVEVPVVSSIRRIMFQYYKDRAQAASTELRQQESQMVIDKTKKAFKDQKKQVLTGLDDFVSSDSKLGLEMLQGEEEANSFDESIEELQKVKEETNNS